MCPLGVVHVCGANPFALACHGKTSMQLGSFVLDNVMQFGSDDSSCSEGSVADVHECRLWEYTWRI